MKTLPIVAVVGDDEAKDDEEGKEVEEEVDDGDNNAGGEEAAEVDEVAVLSLRSADATLPTKTVVGAASVCVVTSAVEMKECW